MHQAEHQPGPGSEDASTLREIADPDVVAQTPGGPPPNVLIVKQTASRGISPRAAVALLALILAVGGLALRGQFHDWQGLWTESQDRWTTPETATPPPAIAQIPPAAPKPDPKPAPEPAPGDLLAAAPAAPEPDKPKPEAKPEAAPREDGTQAALADIEKEAERHRREQEELEQLRKQVERDAPPPAARPSPRRFGCGAPMPLNPQDRQQLARMIREQQLRQIQEMERVFSEMERARANGFQGWPPMMPRLPRPDFGMAVPPAPQPEGARRFVPDPPEPGLPDLNPPPAWPGLDLPRRDVDVKNLNRAAASLPSAEWHG